MRTVIEIWSLPDVLLYQISQFVAPKTARASFLCHTFALLNKAAYKAILLKETSGSLWELILHGDYGVQTKYQQQCSQERRIRRCKRLRRSSIESVRDAHILLRDNTEIAYFYLCELSNNNSNNHSSLGRRRKLSSNNTTLTRAKLCGILNEYGPNLMINTTLSSGGTFLVEICRSRNVNTKATILQCVRELVEQRGALVNIKSYESTSSTLTALAVAAARGLPTVVQYLLSKDAGDAASCSARFRLATNPKKSIRCVGTALDFASIMMKAEKDEGASGRQLIDLQRCIRLLQKSG